jgi:Integrase core domain
VDGRIRSPRVIEVLSRLVSERGAPTFLRSETGPEFVSKALLSWIVGQGIGTALIDPASPGKNGVTESFNGKFRDECLSLEWFRTPTESKVIIETWRQHYNAVRPHSSLGYLRRISSWLTKQTQHLLRQRVGPLRCAGLRARPVAPTASRGAKCSKHGTPSQANRGPKNLGRSAELELRNEAN